MLHTPYLNNIGIADLHGQIVDEVVVAVANILLQNKIIGVCNGFGEAGPRALGNRSLIALANSKELAQKLSMEVKKREWYRPVAPIMLKINAEMVAEQKVTNLARYMLQDFTIKPQYRECMSGVVHANNTARIQTVETENDNPFMYRLLKYLSDNHGIIALINTSFNVQGEPIVHTQEDAFRSAKQMNLGALVYNNQLITNEKF